MQSVVVVAMQEIARTNQKPKDEWRREAPPLIFWLLCPNQNLHCYKRFFWIPFFFLKEEIGVIIERYYA